MAIKNYTSTVSASKSIGEIQEALAENGATRIMTQYDNKQPAGIMFEIETPAGLAGTVFGMRPYLDRISSLSPPF